MASKWRVSFIVELVEDVDEGFEVPEEEVQDALYEQIASPTIVMSYNDQGDEQGVEVDVSLDGVDELPV
jgi:hypothetical protein